MSPYEVTSSGKLSSFSLNRRITVLVMMMTALVVGSLALSRIPVELMPRGFQNPSMWIVTPWQDAPPEEVKDKISIALEEELATVTGIDRMTSVSLTGRAQLFVGFKYGTDMDIAYREIRDRVERARARAEFPDDVEQVYIFKQDVDGIPVVTLGVAVSEDILDSYNLIQDEILLPLSRIDGVASVGTDGVEEKEILIELDREKTQAAGLNIFQIGQELGGDNFSLASGNVRDGARKLMLRSIARYPDLEALEERPINDFVKLKDIANIRYAEPEKTYRVRAMGRPAIAVNVMKEGDANTREVALRVQAVLDRLETNPRLSGVMLMPLFDQGQVIDEALTTLRNSGLVGGVLAACVLFLFLRRVRMTLIVSLSIPLSMIVGLTVMYFAGESLNILSLLGLMISIGLLVDNSVVVAENIYRLYREGMARRDACIHGASEVALAIVMSTLTTVVVFLPAAIVEGPARFFLTRMAIPIAVSLLASLVVALVFIPLAAFLSMPEQGQQRKPLTLRVHKVADRVVGGFYRLTFGLLNRWYGGLLAFFLKRRLELVLVMIVIFGITMALFSQQVEFVGQQEGEASVVAFNIEMPQNSTLTETEDWFLEAEKVVVAHTEEFGFAGFYHFHRTSFGEIQAWMDRDRTSTISAKRAAEILLEKFPKKPGMKIYAGNDRQLDDKEAKGVHTVSLTGDDWRQLDDVVIGLEPMFENLPGVLGLKKSANETPNELGLVVNREKSQKYGVNPQFIAGVVSYALRGTSLPHYRKDGLDIPVRIRFEEGDRDNLDELASFQVPTQDGSSLPLSALTDARFLTAPKAIVRRDKQISRQITIELEEGREDEGLAAITLLVSRIDLPEGIRFGSNRAQQQSDDDLASLQFAGLLSIVFIYLLMGFLFESFVLPLSIVMTIPLAFIGVAWSHIIMGYDIDFLGAVGVLVLVGVVVNNGIVFIDYVNRLRAEGVARRRAMLTAAEHRFRPIMMTAITTIGGLIPLSLAGANSIGLSYTSFALTLIGGMSTATVLTLLVVPVFYTLFDDAREAFGRALKGALKGGRRTAAAAATGVVITGNDRTK
jgi:HAE1 family hydrophobic/amphiphilic exporter-1